MPQVPHDYEINFWVGTGDVLHAVRMEQFPNRDLAIVAGANALFEWAKTDPDKSIPQAALEYWENHRQNPSLTFQDIQADLEAKWGIQFGAKQTDNEPPAPARKPVDAKAEASAGQSNRRLGRDMVPTDDIDIVTLLKQRYASQCSRVKAIDAEIAESRKLRAEVEHDIAKLESMLTAVATIDPPKGNANGQSASGRIGKRRRVHGTLERPAKVRTRRARGDASAESGSDPGGSVDPGVGIELRAGFNGGTGAGSGSAGDAGGGVGTREPDAGT